MQHKTLTLGAALALAAATLTGCSTGSTDHEAHASSGAAESTSTHNTADGMFAQMMKVHHEQALTMSDIVLKHGDELDPEVAQLAEQIRDAQKPEIDLMQRWIEDWDVDSSMSHEGHMTGMLSEEQLDELRAADADEASKLFLQQMIEHHEGAVEMAEDEIEHGKNPEAIELSKTIISTQNEEIDTMRELLAEQK